MTRENRRDHAGFGKFSSIIIRLGILGALVILAIESGDPKLVTLAVVVFAIAGVIAYLRLR